ncbi:MAG TPA: hypothetical protein VJS45_05805 [Acidimicrobiia bacterium]|nr:hypothetical protein [Acidimicrobiia bacterium]
MEESGTKTLTAAEIAERPAVDDVSTAPEESDLLRSRRARTARRAFMLLLFAFLALGLSGQLGVQSRSTTVEGGGYTLTVTYGQVSRPGLATPWSFEVHRPGGFEGPIAVSTKTSYLDMFDENGLDPDPSKATATPEVVIWEFEPPDGDTLSVSFDARIEPAAQWGRSGETSVLEDGKPVVTAKYKTWVMP